MPSSLTQLSKNFIENSFYTKDNKCIDFKCHTYTSEQLEDNPFNYNVIQALVDNQVAGYILTAYISEETQKKLFKSPLDYFIYYHTNERIKQLYVAKKYSDIIELLFEKTSFHELKQKYDLINPENKNTLSLKTLNNFAYKNYLSKYSNFLTQWLNKPNVEMICVYNDLDKKQKDFTSYPFIQEPRLVLTNFRGQGIAQSLYAKACHILQQQNLYLYASNTQTENGQKMWKILENHPKFQVCLDSYAAYLQSSKIIQRKKLIAL